MSVSNTPTPSTAKLGKPRIKILIPPHNPQGNFSYFNAASPYLSTAHSNPSQFSTSGAPQWPASPGVLYGNPNFPPKGRESVFRQFEGFKDIMDWTKTGLNHGEKSAWYLYEKVSKWSRRWFTHIFLMTIVFLYSVAGAYIFIAVEGKILNS